MGRHPSSLLRRLTASPQSLDADQLQSELEKLCCQSVSKLHLGETATVAGRLRGVVYEPRRATPTLEAELFDGSATILLVWLGRRRIPGIEPGRRLRVHARVGEHDGRLAIYNPRYELLQGAA